MDRTEFNAKLGQLNADHARNLDMIIAAQNARGTLGFGEMNELLEAARETYAQETLTLKRAAGIA